MLAHMRQWRRALRSVCGAFAASGFAQTVEDYIRLDPYSIGPGSNMLAKRCRVDPIAMAQGLMALSKVTGKKEKQVSLVGGAVIGWFAALAEYFYDLRVAILSRTGEKLHGDPSGATTQVILVYHEDPDLQVLTGHWSTVQEKASDDDPYWTRHVHFLPFGGRVQWHSLLPQVFGHAFWVLEHEESRTLSDIIGGAARGLEGDYHHHKTHPTDETLFDTHYNSSAYGIGLIQNLTAWLPELRKGQGRMERQLKRTFQEAADTYDQMISRLQTVCNCTVCSITNSTTAPKHGYCLPAICETIIALGLAISRMTVAGGIFPTREGVQGIYTSQSQKRTQAKTLDITHPDQRARYYSIIYGNEWKASPSRRLQNAVELFAGTRPEFDLNDGLLAIAHEGICAYMVALKRSDAGPERDEDRGVIEVTSGAVNLGQKVFTRVSTDPVRKDVAESSEVLSWEEVRFRHWGRVVYCR